MYAAKGRRTLVALALIVLVSSFAGIASWALYIGHLADERAEIAARVCARQDQVLHVLDIIVSPERQALVQGGRPPNLALARSNQQVRDHVDAIEDSPCRN